MALRWHDIALSIDDIIEKFRAIKTLHKEPHKENLRMEFEYDEDGKPIFYVVYNEEESSIEEQNRLIFEANFAEILKQAVERAY